MRAFSKLIQECTCQRWNFAVVRSYSKKINVAVEGNIGSGKTTFLKHFHELSPLVEVTEEPVNCWRNFGGTNPLAILYENPKRWSFTFQSLVLLTLLKGHSQPQRKPIRVMERSLYSAKYCFIQNLKDRGVLSDMEYAVLSECFTHVVQCCHLDLVVYLRTSPEKCFDRIQARNRPEERLVTMDYLQQLHNLHEAWLVESDKGSSMVRPLVLVVDGNRSLTDMSAGFSRVASAMVSLLQDKNTVGQAPAPVDSRKSVVKQVLDNSTELREIKTNTST
ncbi:deoxynucleoside kinase-like isoform X1 [Dreissena polymorpha]|uniref:deoxynucleoside kinase-like isoform X1 n=1 Tax=Dreissena polymorpha TaxID=45954 RepID=UPI002263F67B|nr:deoxynucleoside kinase-like isoform X1 [Dreissena polymorpha]